jgi:hypothetical protein
MEFLKELDRGWQKVVDFKVGDNVTFDVPYLDSKLSYQGKVVEIKRDHAVIQYVNNDNMLTSHISLLDGNGYKRIKGL